MCHCERSVAIPNDTPGTAALRSQRRKISMIQSDQNRIDFLNRHIVDGGFLQSEEWRGFQELVGRKTFHFESDNRFANIIEHTLPWVGTYWYIPRGPVMAHDMESPEVSRQFLMDIMARADQEGVGWIRVEPSGESVLRLWQIIADSAIQEAPHDMQPKEIFVMPIDGDEKDILSRMKSKTRYNIRLAEKKGVKVFVSHEQRHVDAFCDLVEVTAKRDGITPHPRAYYRKMLQAIPESMLKLYVAEYEGAVVAANLVVFFGEYATYLHGASGNDHREMMAPYLLQWRQIQDARANGCEHYDFGGVKMGDVESTWAGITRFKNGFSPHQPATLFLGSYDVPVHRWRYKTYRVMQCVKNFVRFL